MDQLTKVHETVSKDRHPVLVIDEDFAGNNLAQFLCTLVSHHINGPKIFLLSPSQLTECPKGILRENHLLYLPKPFAPEQLYSAIISIAGVHPLLPHVSKEYISELIEQQENNSHYASILIGESPAIKNIRNIIWGIGKNFSSVHINGATGTGKEVVASLLYLRSDIQKPIVVMNCANLSGNLLDAMLFGHIRGAFTDAKESREGLVKKADHSILFLDEIQTLDPVVQGKFLRLIETGTFRPVGSDETLTSDFKLITASNIPLQILLDRGYLREDLYNRINHISIEIPPLKSRKEDIPLLIKHHLSKKGETRKA